MKKGNIILGIVIAGLFFSAILFTGSMANARTLKKDRTATHSHSYEWEGIYLADTTLTINWSYKQYYTGNHMVYSEIVSHGDPAYKVNKNPWLIFLSQRSKKGVVEISSQEQVAYGDTYFNILGYGEVSIYTTIHYSSTGFWYAEDGFGEYI